MTNGEKIRKKTYQYTVEVDGIGVKVCQIFFLRTLGFKSHRVLLTVMQTAADDIIPQPDARGKRPSVNKIAVENIEFIRSHIMSYDPSMSHYRRVHAPSRHYLPCQLSIAEMHRDYLVSAGSHSHEIYMKEVKLKNISFAKLGEEGSENCLIHNDHKCPGSDSTNISVECHHYNEHDQRLKRSALSKHYYQIDAAKNNSTVGSIFSVDLQKVIMMPPLPGVKTVVFPKRIIAYNETFAPLGKKSGDTIAVTWHEGIGGRDAPEIASCFEKFIFLRSNRDIKNFTFWVDNCSVQNKNWFAYTAFCYLVNLSDGPESITMKYFRKGHTFMSADSLNARVEKEIKTLKNLFDFNDFVSALDNAGKSVVMDSNDIIDYPRGVSQGSFAKEKPKLDNVYISNFQKGSSKIYWQEDFDSTVFQSSEFLQKRLAAKIQSEAGNFDKKYPLGPPGIQISKKDDIVKKLCPLLPRNRHSFWNTIFTNES